MPQTILIIREYDEFSRILAGNGCEIENLPLIETKPLDDLREFGKRLGQIDIYDGIFITSRNAARIFADKLRERNIIFKKKIYVLGAQSFEILKNKQLDFVFDETANTAKEMLENIALEDLKGKRFLFVRGEKSLRVVPEFLAEFGKVDETVVYETRAIALEVEELKKLREKFKTGEFAAACFFSPSAAESFLSQIGAQVLHQTVIATIGKTTAGFLERRNLKVDFVSSKSSAENFANELIEYLRKND